MKKTMKKSNLIRFDWAFKRLLRQKANFVVLEGFLTSLLERPISILEILDSESNKQESDDKFNRVDLLAKNQDGELLIIEVQNNRELDYFHRMLYGTAKVITEYIKESQAYASVKKVYSINIVYFELGQGRDYVYRGVTEFRGIHENDILHLSASQKRQFRMETVGDIYPEYYVLRVEDFNTVAKTPLDEWIEFLKTGDIATTATAPGLREAREKLRKDRMSEAERNAYEEHLENLRYQKSVITTGIIEGRMKGLEEGVAIGRAEGLAAGKAEGLAEGEHTKAMAIAVKALQMGMSIKDIVALTGLNEEDIKRL